MKNLIMSLLERLSKKEIDNEKQEGKRVFDLAKEYDLPALELLFFLRKNGLSLRNHLSRLSIDEELNAKALIKNLKSDEPKEVDLVSTISQSSHTPLTKRLEESFNRKETCILDCGPYKINRGDTFDLFKFLQPYLRESLIRNTQKEKHYWIARDPYLTSPEQKQALGDFLTKLNLVAEDLNTKIVLTIETVIASNQSPTSAANNFDFQLNNIELRTRFSQNEKRFSKRNQRHYYQALIHERFIFTGEYDISMGQGFSYRDNYEGTKLVKDNKVIIFDMDEMTDHGRNEYITQLMGYSDIPEQIENELEYFKYKLKQFP